MIIDGDGALFTDDLLAKGETGGTDAAHQLQKHITKYTEDVCSDMNVEHARTFVYLAINMAGMASSLEKTGVLKSKNDLAPFMRAFCLAQPLYSVVDVGHGKERADHKCRQLFDAMVRVPQCKHVIFGPCHDAGYVTVLESYKSYASKISLFETTPAVPSFRQLGYKFCPRPEVFRSEPLLEPPSVSENCGSPASGSNIISTARLGTATKAHNPSKRFQISAIARITTAPTYVLLNASRQRVDESLPKYDAESYERYNQKIINNNGKKFCSEYHLRNNCEWGKGCTYEHGSRLPEAEVTVLKHKARNSKCKSGLQCREIDCPYGHICLSGGRPCKHKDTCNLVDTHHFDPVSGAPHWAPVKTVPYENADIHFSTPVSKLTRMERKRTCRLRSQNLNFWTTP